MKIFLTLVAFPLLTACESARFYTQGMAGQIEIIRKSRPNAEVITDPATTEGLRNKLRLAEELRDFARRELALPADQAYGRYADLGRRHVVFVLHAAPEFSMEPKKWRYPLVGEMDYRGYFAEADAKELATKLEAQGYEIHLGGTNAYSTLGLFHDPVLNTFADYPEIDFAELIFHELTHVRHFRKGDTTFNESLANMVAEEGVRRWLKSKGRKAELADYEERLIRRRDFYREIESTRVELTRLYASGLPESEMRARKGVSLDRLKARARALQERWGGKLLEDWLRLDLTNAHLLALVTYNSGIASFREKLSACGGDFESLFRKLENEERGRSGDD